jgi:hypothetical protein
MKRKVLRVGNASLAVSLPNKWVRQYGVLAGQELEIFDSGNCLQIGAALQHASGVVEITVPSVADFSRRLVFSSYIKGNDEIIVRSEDSQVLSKAVDAAVSMLGFDALVIDESHVILKNIAKTIDDDFDAYFRRLVYTVRLMGKLLNEAMAQGRMDCLDDLLRLELLSNKLSMFCKRMLNLDVSMDRTVLTPRYVLLVQLEQVCDAYRDIGIVLSKRFDTSLEAKLFVERAVFLVDYFCSHYKKADVAMISALRKEVKDLKRSVLETDLTTPTAVLIYTIADIIDTAAMDAIE